MELRTSNLNAIWADLIVEQLRRSGVRCFSLAPGSRSTPLVAAIARHTDLDVSMHVDERGAAFFAVGYARATGRPAAFITTSGTAGANGYPAIIEASESLLPLLVITADRPAELRDTGANQTIDQVKMFGDYARWFFDLPAPDTQIDPHMVLTTVAQAVHRAQRTPQGPVHLNAMFREPLAPVDDGHDRTEYVAPLQGWLGSTRAFSMSVPPRNQMQEEHVEEIAALLSRGQHGLVVVGELGRDDERAAVLRLAEKLKWPLLPDINSGLRLGAPVPYAIPFYDQILADHRFAETHRPDVVVHFGGPFVSKRLLQFLDRMRPLSYVVVKDHPFRYDPNHQITHSVEADIALACQALVPFIESSSETCWLRGWQAAAAAVSPAIDRFLADQPAINEPAVARTITQLLAHDHALFIGNSMPVRDMDMFAVADAARVPVAVNRGASGIDGNIATAVGFAHGLERPTTVLVGDLTLLHDINSLLLVRDSRVPLTIIVINNNGGGIFSFLPIAQHGAIFEPFFGTPQRVTFEYAARMFNLQYMSPRSISEFEATYRAATGSKRSTLIEVCTDRQENVELHARLREQITAAINVNQTDTETQRS